MTMCWSILYKLKGKINPFDMYYAIASVRKLQMIEMKLNVTHKRGEQALMPRRMDTSVIFSTKHNRTGNVSLLYS